MSLANAKHRTKLGLSKYAAEAAEEAAEHPDKLGIAAKVRDVAGIIEHSGRKKISVNQFSIWPFSRDNVSQNGLNPFSMRKPAKK